MTLHEKPVLNLRLTRKEREKLYGDDKEWAKEIANYYRNNESRLFINTSRHIDEITNITENLDMIEHGYFNNQKYENIVTPYKTIQENTHKPFNIDVENFDIVSQKIKTLLGEEIRRPFDYQVCIEGEDYFNEIKEQQLELVRAYIYSKFAKEVQEQGGPELEQIELETPQGKIENEDQLMDFIQTGVVSQIERASDELLKYLITNLGVKNLFEKNFKKLLACGREVYYVSSINGEPYIRTVDTRYFDYDRSNDDNFLNSASWFVEDRYLTKAQLINEYGSILKEEDLEEIEKISSNLNDSSNSPLSVLFNDVRDWSGPNIIKVTTVEFVAQRKIGVLKYYDPVMEEVVQELVDEDFKIDKQANQVVDWYWVNEWWEVVLVGEDLVIKANPLPYQYQFIEDLFASKSSYVGINLKYSLVDIIKPYQYLFNVIMYKWKLLLAKSKGAISLIDTAFIPSKKDWNFSTFLQAIDETGIGIIDRSSLEKEKIPFYANAKVIETVDMSHYNAIQSLIQQMQVINDFVKQLTGITDARLGQQISNTTATGIERSVTQSAAITEWLFYYHEVCKCEVLERLLLKTQQVWQGSKKLINYGGNGSKILFELNKEFYETPIKLKIKYDYKDNAIMSLIQEFAKIGIQNNTVSFGDAIDILRTNSLTTMKRIMEKSYRKSQESQSQSMQQQQEAMMQAQAQEHQNKIELITVEYENKRMIEELKLQAIITGRQLDLQFKITELEQKMMIADENIKNDLMKIKLDYEIELKKLEQQKQALNTKKD